RKGMISMRNSMKIAKWEIKRNMKNKTFLIGLFLTPILIVAFFLIGSLFDEDNNEESEQLTVYVNDQLELFSGLEETIEQSGLNIALEKTELSESEVENALQESENTAYIFIDQ